MPAPRNGPSPRTPGAEAPLVLSGRVTDAKTGRPIERFTVIPGHDSQGRGNRFWERSTAKAFTGGQYRYTIAPQRFTTPQPQLRQFLRIEAAGYPAAVSRPIEPGTGPLVLDFQLDASAGIAGVVRNAAGKPLPDATVVVCLTTRWTQINNNEVRPNNINTVSLTVGPDGRFLVPAADAAHAVLAIHESGIGLATLDELRAAGTLVVKPWARVEGVFRVGPTPTPNQTIELDYMPMEDLAREHNGHILLKYETTTDSRGRYVFPKVPGMEATLGRRIILAQSEHGGFTSTRGPTRKIAVKPGATLQADLGGSGRPVVGKITLPNWFAGTIDWGASMASLNLEQDGRLSSDRSYGFKIDRDGAFRVDDVDAGQYRLMILAVNPPAKGEPAFGRPAGSLQYTFSVPKTTAETQGKPIDLGKLELQVSALPDGKPPRR